LNACQQLDIGGVAPASAFSPTVSVGHDAVGVHQRQPLGFELILRLLFVVRAPLYRCFRAGVGIERLSAVDLAAARNIECGRVVRDGDNQM
jgi:hypothetical protein